MVIILNALVLLFLMVAFVLGLIGKIRAQRKDGTNVMFAVASFFFLLVAVFLFMVGSELTKVSMNAQRIEQCAID